MGIEEGIETVDADVYWKEKSDELATLAGLPALGFRFREGPELRLGR